MITYKWRITEHKYAYICNSDGNTPFIRLAKCDDTCYITKGNTYCRSNSNVAKFSSDDKISRQVYSMSEAVYARLFDEMKELIATDDDGKTMKILDYHYYWNIDNDNCSLVQYGYKGNEGLPGKDGRGIANITSAYTNGDLIMHIQYTDGQEDNFPLPVGHDGAPGKDGEKGNDGNNSSTIIEINNAKSELEDIRINELSAITQTLNRLLDKSKDELEKTKEDLSGITDSVGTVSSVTLNLSGYTYEFNKFIGASAMTKTEFSREISAVDGRIEEIGSRVDVINNTVTDYNKRVDLVEGKLSTTLSKFDETKNQLNAFQQEYDVVNNKLSQVVSELTNNGDISFSEIYQTAHQLGLLVSNHDKDNPIMAEIIAQINSSGSSILISADKIVISGETIAKKLNAVDVTINGGYSRFNRDGSGYLAKENIFWDSDGNLTIKKDVKIEGVLTVGDVANGLKDEDVTLCGNDPRYNCVFKKNGSGYLGGGAIAWTSSGDTFITGNLIIGGAAKEDMVNYINGTNLNLGQGTSSFNKDGSGSLAGGMITWNNKREMTIKASVKIDTTDDTTGSGITDNIIAALSAKDLVINGGASRFFASGAGWLAKKAIRWDEDGNIWSENEAWYLKQDGSGKFAKGKLTWNEKGTLTVTDSNLTNVIINGVIKTPFHDGYYVLGGSDDHVIVETPGLQNNNNIVIPGSGGDWVKIPFDSGYSGFRAIVMNDDWKGVKATGAWDLTAPNGKYYYEDGAAKSKITLLPHTGVEMIGYGDTKDKDLKGWIILNRIEIKGDRGFPFYVCFCGIVNSEGTLIKSKKCNEDNDVTVTKRTETRSEYVVRFKKPWSDANNYMVFLTGQEKEKVQLCASIYEKERGYFVVYCGPDDGGFQFMVVNVSSAYLA